MTLENFEKDDYVIQSKKGRSGVLFSLTKKPGYETGFQLKRADFDTNINALYVLYRLACFCHEQGVKSQARLSFEVSSADKLLNALRGIEGCAVTVIAGSGFKVAIDLNILRSHYAGLYHFDSEVVLEDCEFDKKCETLFSDCDDDDEYHQLFGYVVKDSQEKMLGGVVCNIKEKILNIEMLALDPQCRGKTICGEKISRLLMSFAEQKGYELGCRFSKVDTGSIQAPWLYPSSYDKDGSVCRYVKISNMPIGAGMYSTSKLAPKQRTLFWGYDGLVA